MKRDTESDEQAIAEARTMLSAFMSVSITIFGVTWKDADGQVVKYEKRAASRLLGRIATIVPRAESDLHSVIVRPFFEWETSLVIVQADDLDAARAQLFSPFAFCMTETSPGNYQAFACVVPGEDFTGEISSIHKRVNSALAADPGASCAGRLAGTLNTKRVHLRADGSYPRVRLVNVNASRVVKTEELRLAGLLLDVPHVSAPAPRKLAPSVKQFPAARRRLPSYEKSLASVQIKDDGTPNRSAADLLFAVTCLRWIPPLSREEIADLLMEHSEKAQERKTDADWYIEATIDEAERRV
jgi:hypothetical protein